MTTTNLRHYATVVGYQREEETPAQVINGTSPAGMAQVEGWVLDVVAIHARMYRSVSFRQIAVTRQVDRPLLGPLLARLVDAGRLVWAEDGGYLLA